MIMKRLGILLMIISIVTFILYGIIGIFGHYQYEKQFESYWNLADKASTIPQKARYLDLFVEKLEKGNFKGQYNAIFLTTPDNSFDKNFEALKSLQTRLHEIQEMKITSFEYQTAIQQITAQEQGEAQEMLRVFSGIWWKNNHIFLWTWILAIGVCFFIVTFFTGLIIWGNEF